MPLTNKVSSFFFFSDPYYSLNNLFWGNFTLSMHHAYQARRAAGGSVLPVVSQDTITAEKRLEKQAKWHRNVRRRIEWDGLANTTTCQTSHREP